VAFLSVTAPGAELKDGEISRICGVQVGAMIQPAFAYPGQVLQY
jgi:hypothetical protein